LPRSRERGRSVRCPGKRKRVSRAQRSTKRSGVVRCRPGTPVSLCLRKNRGPASAVHRSAPGGATRCTARGTRSNLSARSPRRSQPPHSPVKQPGELSHSPNPPYRPRASGDSVTTARSVNTGSQLSAPLIPAQAGIQSHESGMWRRVPRLRGDERMSRSSRPFHFFHRFKPPSRHTFPVARPVAALRILPSARPDEGVGGAP
jgi:hypothetical protein